MDDQDDFREWFVRAVRVLDSVHLGRPLRNASRAEILDRFRYLMGIDAMAAVE